MPQPVRFASVVPRAGKRYESTLARRAKFSRIFPQFPPSFPPFCPRVGDPWGERQRAWHVQGKVLYARNYPNPSFGPFEEVCCSIIGCFKLLLHSRYDMFEFLSIFTHFHPFFCSLPPHPLLSRLISPHFGDPEKAGVM